jgi:predicted cation transporter
VTVIFASLLVLVVLLGPILLRPVERNLELFFLIVGILTAAAMGQFSPALVRSALSEPVALSAAVLVFGVVFRFLRNHLDHLFAGAIRIFGERCLCFGLTIIAGLFAGFITVVIAALVFVEAISLLRLDRKTEVAATVCGCFAIGIGGGLTPLGMPASTLVLAALHADFWYLARLLGPFIVAGIVLAAIPVLFLPMKGGETHPIAERDPWTLVVIRAGKVYIFIAGLVALSRGLRPVVDVYLVRVPDALLFWLNTLSAVVDNATLAAIEIGPALNATQQRAAMLSLLISGGMLIPGNIPNIVAAGRLGIASREWIGPGLRIGLALLITCFAVLSLMAICR